MATGTSTTLPMYCTCVELLVFCTLLIAGTWRCIITVTFRSVDYLNLWDFPCLLSGLHCGNLVSVAQLGYPPLRRWTAFAAPTLSCGLSERGDLSLCHCVNVRQSQRLRRQHSLLNSLDREVLSSCDQLNFHHSIGELRLQRFHCFLNSLQHEVLSSCRRLLPVIFSFYCFQDRCFRSHLNDAKPTRDNAGSLPVT